MTGWTEGYSYKLKRVYCLGSSSGGTIDIVTTPPCRRQGLQSVETNKPVAVSSVGTAHINESSVPSLPDR